MESECEYICACVWLSQLSTAYSQQRFVQTTKWWRDEEKIGKSVIAFICLKRWEHDSPATKFRSVGNLIRFRAQNITKDTEEEEEVVVVPNRESDGKTDEEEGAWWWKERIVNFDNTIKRFLS